MFRRILTILAALFSAFLFAGASGQARIPASEGTAVPTSYTDCPLERIGTQLVRCDNLTGAGVEAPFWIPEQK